MLNWSPISVATDPAGVISDAFSIRKILHLGCQVKLLLVKLSLQAQLPPWKFWKRRSLVRQGGKVVRYGISVGDLLQHWFTHNRLTCPWVSFSMSANCSVTTGYWFPVIVNSIYLGMSFKRVNRFASAVDHPTVSYLFWWNSPSWGASASKLVALKFFGCNKNLPKAVLFASAPTSYEIISKLWLKRVHPGGPHRYAAYAQLLILALPDLVTALFLDLWICLCESDIFSPEDQPQAPRDWVI